MKRCRKCGELKPLTEFYREKGCRDGYRNDCKACFAARSKQWYLKNREHVVARVKTWQQANAERHNAYQRQYRADHAQQFREGHLRRVFKLTSAEYEALLEAQGGVCAVCKRAPRAGRSLHVDHDHETGAVRGLLCFSCNAGLGQFHDDPLRIAAVIVYLATAGHPDESSRPEREAFINYVCEMVGVKFTGVDPSAIIDTGGASHSGDEETPE